MKRFFLSLLLTLSLIPTITAHAYEYADVTPELKCYKAVDYLERNDVFPQTANFSPDLVINRAAFIQYLVLLNSRDFSVNRTVTLPFSDTQNDAYYAPYIAEAIDLGIISSHSGELRPYQRLNMVDALRMLHNSHGLPVPNIYSGKIESIPYLDVKRNPAILPLAMRSVSLGLIDPISETSLGIYRSVSKCEAANLIYRMDLAASKIAQSNSPKADDQLGPEFNKIKQAWEILLEDYVDAENIDKETLSDSALKGLVDGLNDPYSDYLNQQEMENFKGSLSGSFQGIGAYIDLTESGQVTIVAPIPDSPAEAAGLKAGDIILKVGEQSLEGYTTEQAATLIRGPEGTEVTLTLKRGEEIFEVTLVRALVKIVSLTYSTEANGKVGYLKLSQFGETTAQELRSIIELILLDPKIEGLVIDVRDNPGGLLNAVNEINSFFLPKEAKLVSVQGNSFEETTYNPQEGILLDLPLAVIINKGSASASEILAGALQDHGRAIILGEQSFGKGTVQQTINYGDGSAIKLTIAKWLTPNGQNIHGVGISPDIVITLPEDFDPATDDDLQMKRAIEEVLD